ncbi:hypothetical protein TraAM80_08765, partial [Trypanosoma rangeli]
EIGRGGPRRCGRPVRTRGRVEAKRTKGLRSGAVRASPEAGAQKGRPSVCGSGAAAARCGSEIGISREAGRADFVVRKVCLCVGVAPSSLEPGVWVQQGGGVLEGRAAEQRKLEAHAPEGPDAAKTAMVPF